MHIIPKQMRYQAAPLPDAGFLRFPNCTGQAERNAEATSGTARHTGGTICDTGFRQFLSNLNGTTFFSRMSQTAQETLRRMGFIRGNVGEKR